MTVDLSIAAVDELVRVAGEALPHFESSIVLTQLQQQGHSVLEENPDALLVLGVPGIPLATQHRWLGVRISIWPRVAFESRRIAVVSSRLGRKLGQQPEWFDAFRTLVCQLNADEESLITAVGTTADRFVKRAAQLFGINAFTLTPTTRPPARHITSFRSECGAGQIELSEPLIPATTDQLISAPLGDRLLTSLAHHVRALAVRSGSQTHAGLKHRLTDDSFPVATVHVTRDSEAAEDLADAGAALRILLRPQSDQSVADIVTSAKGILAAPPFDDYLLHWTRSPDGPWPDEAVDDYLDALILGVEASDRTAFAALSRIVETRTLLCSAHLIRGQHRVVCFSNLELHTLPSRRTYRAHLHRWDYEPYGIGMRKSWLTRLGTRPVIYSKSNEYATLSTDDKPFFQQAVTEDARTRWTDESEWRCLGDVNLDGLSSKDVFVFVPSEHEAEAIRQHCPWPVVVLPSKGT